MIRKGSLVEYTGQPKYGLFTGQLLSVCSTSGDTAELYVRKKDGMTTKDTKWGTVTIPLSALKEIIA